MPRGGQQEVVMLFNAEEEIQDEMFFSAFDDLLAGKKTLERYAASSTKAAYCVVGNGLTLRGIVFFMFHVDEEGFVDPTFNLPLRYLVQNAGVGFDLGQGGIRKASRAQCPVPWHAVNLWEPAAEECIEALQKRIYRNKLKLKASVKGDERDFFPPEQESLELLDNHPDTTVDYRQGAVQNGEPEKAETEAPQSVEFSAKLNEVFGEAGKLSLQDLIRLHSEQLDQAKSKYRKDIEAQQLSYLDQIRECREQIHELKVTLRQEQGRNRRLQQMLRGDL